jgi:hypothetical protein
MTAIEARVDAFEVELTGFFAQLNDIHDPAALASALKRIPQAPSLTDAPAAPAGDTAPSPAAAAAAKAEPATPEVAEPAESTADATVAESVNAVAEPVASGNGMPESDADAHAAPAVATAVAEPEAETEAETEAEPAPVEAVAEAPAAPAPADEAASQVTTQVLVTGLTSFGAITSFKQSLERVDGVSRVSLGLGTSGEFIFTAVHREGFDLAAAIRSFEESAQFVASNGQLRVTVGSKA